MARTSTAPKPVNVTSKLDGFTAAYEATVTKLAAVSDHHDPALAALLLATRQARGGISQMALGTNRTKDGKVIVSGVKTPADISSAEKGSKKSGWFSLIANVEQGGRKTAIPAEFVPFVAKMAETTEDNVRALIEQDAALRTAGEQANAPAETPAVTA